MIFDLLAPPQGPGVGTLKMVPLHVPFIYTTHTPNLVELGKQMLFEFVMIFDLLALPQGLKGRGQKSAVECPFM